MKASVDRRDFVTLLGAGLLSALGGGCWWHGSSRSAIEMSSTPELTPPGTDVTATQAFGAIPPPRPGKPEVVFHAAPSLSRQFALTIDDGYCPECVEGYVAFAERTGIHLTFSPNGILHDLWDGYADRLRPLIERGHVQIGNHTWSHPNLLWARDGVIRQEIERNEEWIEQTFGITARPWFRPPFGKHNGHIDGIAGSLGYTRILMWNGTLGDATVETPDVLLGLARKWIKSGSIVLGHANHPAVVALFDDLQQLIDARSLQPVTLDEMFGTSRAEG